MRGPLFLTLFMSASVFASAQTGKNVNSSIDTVKITFKDTVCNLAFDSTHHNLGQIKPVQDNYRLVKHFKYIGKEPVVITRAWTGDPHYICEYPREPLIPGNIYSFTVCFWHQGRQGKLSKSMGFDLSNGNRISLMFTGTYLPLNTEGK